MSKILYVCYRDYQKKIKSLEEKIKNICDDLNPDNKSANTTITSLLHTSQAADNIQCVHLWGRSILKKQKT